MVSDVELEDRIKILNVWLREGQKFPNNYRNMEMIVPLTTNLINDLVSERKKLIKQLDRLNARLASLQPKE
jgi:hypothetical protein